MGDGLWRTAKVFGAVLLYALGLLDQLIICELFGFGRHRPAKPQLHDDVEALIGYDQGVLDRSALPPEMQEEAQMIRARLLLSRRLGDPGE